MQSGLGVTEARKGFRIYPQRTKSFTLQALLIILAALFLTSIFLLNTPRTRRAVLSASTTGPDVNRDGVVDIRDVIISKLNFAK